MKLFIILTALFCAPLFASQSEKVVVFYSSERCAGCVAEKKTLDEIGITYFPGGGDANAKITVYPTIIVLIDGKEVSRIVGNKSKEELERLLK